MIKDKLMKALKTAVSDYNGGMSADMAVACAAEAWDFNENQTERLVEMFNTLATLNKEKDKDDPAGSCELADKKNVAKILVDGDASKNDGGDTEKKAMDYSFYSTSPAKTNRTIEARRSGLESMVKAAESSEEKVPDEINVSQRSLYKIIEGKIGQLKAAASAAEEVVRNLAIEIERDTVKIAKAIEDPSAREDAADLFRAACNDEDTVSRVAEYSTKVAESDGGRFAKAFVFDSSPIDDILKIAERVSRNAGMVSEYNEKKDFFLSKAAEAQAEVLEAVGLAKKEVDVGLADMFRGVPKKASSPVVGDKDDGLKDEAETCTKIAEFIRESGVSAEEVGRLAEELEKDAASYTTAFTMPLPSIRETHSSFTSRGAVDSEKKRLINVRRSVILADLMTNDPIIRDADPNQVAEVYKTMVMTSPRVSLDKSQVRAFLRSAVNSVAISPSDAKVIADVDKGVRVSNVDSIDALTRMDSSIKDSNV